MTPTQVLTLGALAVAWLVVAFPLAMRTRNESVAGQVTGFHDALSVLEPDLKAHAVSTRSTPRPGGVTQTLRRLLLALVGSTVITITAAVMVQGMFVPLAIVSSTATVAFVGLLRRRKVERDRAEAVITSIRTSAGLPDRRREARPQPMPQPMPRAVGGPGGLAHGVPDDVVSDRAAARRQYHDVRVIDDASRVRAHRGFDVVD